MGGVEGSPGKEHGEEGVAVQGMYEEEEKEVTFDEEVFKQALNSIGCSSEEEGGGEEGGNGDGEDDGDDEEEDEEEDEDEGWKDEDAEEVEGEKQK